jgi:hypothetical protein
VSRATILLFVTFSVLAACTNSTVPPKSTESPSTTDGAIPFDSGIEGTLSRSRNASGDEDSLLEGQIVVWAASSDEPPVATTTDITLFGRPLEAVLVSEREFAVELGPGWYRVRGTAFGGEVCDEFMVEVKPNEITQADFVCR